MKYTWVNGGQPLPENHQRAGLLAILLDYEDGNTPTQRVYGKDPEEIMQKMTEMYGNTRKRVSELQSQVKPPAQPRLSPEERQRRVDELNDPNRAPDAIVDLVKDATGVDLKREKEEKDRSEAEAQKVARWRAATENFIAEHKDYVANKVNAMLLRDRAISRFGDITEESLHQSFVELQESGVLSSTPEKPMEHPLATDPEDDELSAPEPSAHTSPENRPRSTGVRPSQFRGVRPPATSDNKMTYDQILDFAANQPEEYARRYQEESEFRAMVNKVADPIVRS